MKQYIKHAMLWSLASLTIGLVTPSLIIFILDVLVGGINPVTSVADIWYKQLAEGHNLLLLATIGLIPFVILSIVIFVVARKRTPLQLALISLGGLIGILSLMVPMHISIWYPMYGAGHVSSTAVVGFLFIPFYCVVTLIIGLIIGWGIYQLPYFKRQNNVVA